MVSEKFSLKNSIKYKESTSSLTFCHPAILQFLIGAFFFVVHCKELKLHKLIKFNQLFQCFSLIGVYGYVLYGLTCMLMSKNVNNDVTMNPTIRTCL